MRFGFGLVTCQHHPDDGRTDAEIHGHAVELCVRAEQGGFDSVWTSEHHFVDDAYAPSLLVLSAAIAQATSRVDIGTGILLAPLHHPLRVAEDAATADLLSGGRLILGLGAGWREEEFDGFDTPLGERAERMRESVRILRAAWSDGTVAGSGPWTFPELSVTPKPGRAIPIWIGGFSEPAMRRAGRIADGFLGSSSGTSGIPAFRRAKEIVTAAGTAAGRDMSSFTFALHVPVFAWEDGDAWQTVKPYYQYLRWKYADMGPARAKTGPPASPPPLDGATEASLRPTIICGTPGEVVAQIEEYRAALGDDTHFIFRSYFAGMPREMQDRALDVIATRVLGELR